MISRLTQKLQNEGVTRRTSLSLGGVRVAPRLLLKYNIRPVGP